MRTDQTLSNSQATNLIIILPLLIFARVTYFYWPEYYLEAFIFLMLVALILINKENLQDLYIDQTFVLILALTGILYSLYVWTSILAFITISASIYLVQILIAGKLKFGELNPFSLRINTLIGLVPVIMLAMFSSPISIFQHAILNQRLLLWVIYTNLLSVVLLEMMFWGLLWSLLCIRGTSNPRIFVVQIVLFSIVELLTHSLHFTFTSIVIAVVTSLMVGAWQGFLAWRSKSLTPGTIGYSLVGILLGAASHFK